MSYPVLYKATEREQTPAIAGVGIVGLTIVGDTTSHGDPFETQGLGTMSDAISCTVTEKRNGSYELLMTYPVSGVHFEELQTRRILLSKANYSDDPQPFRIYRITKPLNGVCTVYAQHLSYDLNGYPVPMGITASTAAAACAALNEWAPPFNISGSHSTAEGDFETNEPGTIRSWLGRMLNIYGGEWHWNGYDCDLYDARGQNRGVVIRYGSNLTALKQTEDSANVYSGVIAYYKDEGGVYHESDQYAVQVNDPPLEYTRVYYLDVTSQMLALPEVARTKARLNLFAMRHITGNNLAAPDLTLDFSFVHINEQIDLCDTVTVIYDGLGVTAQAKCVETTWDALKERYTQIKIGEAMPTIVDTIAAIDARTK